MKKPIEKATNLVDMIDALKKPDWHKRVHRELLLDRLQCILAEGDLLRKQLIARLRLEMKGKDKYVLLKKHYEEHLDLRFNNSRKTLRLICKVLPD